MPTIQGQGTLSFTGATINTPLIPGTASLSPVSNNLFNYGYITSSISFSDYVNFYNFGIVYSIDTPTVSFLNGGYGKIINIGIIDGNISVLPDHEDDYVVVLNNQGPMGGLVTQLGASSYDLTIGSEQIFGLLDGDVTNHVVGDFGTAEDDIIEGDSTSQTMHGFNGNDWILGKFGNDTIIGDDGEDMLSGGAGDDNIFGGLDNDIILGGLGNDTLRGGFDFDMIGGGAGNDRIFGGAGNDILSGGAGNDIVVGGIDGDRLQGDQGRDFLFGGTGTDAFVFTDLANSVTGAADVVFDFEQGSDWIDLIDTGISDISELAIVQNIGTNSFTTITTFDTSNNFQINLSGVFTLTDDDFVFDEGAVV